MGLFGSKKKSYLGIDFGSGGIKLVELKSEKGRAKLFTYAFTERMPGAEPLNLVDAPEEAADLLKKMLAKAKVTTSRAITGLPVASVFSSVVTVPRGNEKEINDAARWQAKKLIPVPLDEMQLDFKPINGYGKKAKKEKKTGGKGKGDEEKKTVQVLITGASKAMIEKYIKVFGRTGLDLASLETETLALIRSLVGKDRSTTMLVDIGASRTNIIIVENGIPYVTRSVDMGGVSLTRAMAKTLSMDLKGAEEMKTDIKSVSTLYPGEGMPKIFEKTMAPMVTELQYSINLYTGQAAEGEEKGVEKIILTGGTAALPALAGYFSGQLNMKVYVGDPWARVAYPGDLRPVLDEIGTRFSVAVGLAMSEME
ncbi:MAG: type IV pilus assembly protein PilM [Patescibacteria group bacterium]|nr:type IV pilus assembly protein PilM [Patescibacteria group bacterium]